MAPKKRTRTTPGAEPSSQVHQLVSGISTNARNRGNLPNPVGLTNTEHGGRYNDLSSTLVVATWYFDKDLLTSLGFDVDFMFCFKTPFYLQVHKVNCRQVSMRVSREEQY